MKTKRALLHKKSALQRAEEHQFKYNVPLRAQYATSDVFLACDDVMNFTTERVDPVSLEEYVRDLCRPVDLVRFKRAS